MSDVERRTSYLTVKTFTVIVGIVLTVVVAVFGYQSNRINDVEAKADELAQEDAKTGAAISELKANRVNDIERLSRIELKVDKILERLK